MTSAVARDADEPHGSGTWSPGRSPDRVLPIRNLSGEVDPGYAADVIDGLATEEGRAVLPPGSLSWKYIPDVEAWFCYACGVFVRRGVGCALCDREEPPHWWDPLELEVDGGRFRCTTCGEWYQVNTTCPRCASTYREPPAAMEPGEPRGRQYTEEEATHGLDPLEGLPVVLDGEGCVAQPPRYGKVVLEFKERGRAAEEWWAERRRNRHPNLGAVICPVPEAALPPPVCRRCKCPGGPTLRSGAASASAAVEDRSVLAGGLCGACRDIEEKARRLLEVDAGKVRAQIEEHYARMDEHALEVERLQGELERLQRSRDAVGPPTDEEVAKGALAFMKDTGCSEAVAAGEVGWSRQRLNSWKRRLLERHGEDLEKWTASHGPDSNYWAVKLEERRQRGSPPN